MIPVSAPLFYGNEARYLQECIASGWLSGDGPFVKRFETEFAEYIGRKHGIAVSSGTAALDIAVAALDIGLNDEVIVPTFTIISCINQIVRSGATPVFVDCDPLTWNLDVSKVEAAITRRTKAIMPVHIYGMPVDMDPLLALAKQHELKIIEDAAEAHGLKYKGKRCGSLGDLSTFSFYSNKVITTGEGGMVLTDDDELAEKCRSLRSLCFGPPQVRRYVHERLGFNYRMTNMQAAVGVAQLEHIPYALQVKRTIGELYTKSLGHLSDFLQLPVDETPYAENIYWVYPVVFKRRLAADMAEKLKARGIMTRPFFQPLHLQRPLRMLAYAQRFPVAEHAAEFGLYLPTGPAITTDEMMQVVRALEEIV